MFTILYKIAETYCARIASYKPDNFINNLAGAFFMKKNFVFAAFLALFVMATAAFAQGDKAKGASSPNFGGKWTLDKEKSKLSDQQKASIESETMTVTQSASDIKYELDTKRVANPNGGGAPAGGGGGGAPGARPGGGGGGFGGGAGGAQTYPLGKEVTADQQMGQNTVPVTSGSKWDGGKLQLWRSSTFQGPNGEIKNSSKQTWELSSDGKTLTINSENTGARGTTSTTKVYTKAS